MFFQLPYEKCTTVVAADTTLLSRKLRLNYITVTLDPCWLLENTVKKTQKKIFSLGAIRHLF